eukprot:PhM_4_TR12001/c0_g1_i1/m.52688
MSKLSSDLLREFYFSGATDLKSFEKKKQKNAAGIRTNSNPNNTTSSPSSAAAATVADRTKAQTPTAVVNNDDLLNISDLPRPNTAMADVPTASTITTSTTPLPAVPNTRGGAFAASTRSERRSLNNTTHSPAPAVDAATPEYMEYLRLCQDLQVCHQSILSSTRNAESQRVAYQAEITHLRRRACEAIREIEASTNWNLKSRYDGAQLLRDCSLSMQTQELRDGNTEPQYLELKQQMANTRKVMERHATRIAYPTYEPALQGIVKRLEAVEAEVKNSNLDIAAMSRLPDAILIQADHILSQPTCEDLLLSTEHEMEHLLFLTDDERSKRDAAMENGEMVVAEEHALSAIEHQEVLLKHIRGKISVLDGRLKENAVFKKVNDMYAHKYVEDIQKIRVGHDRTKQRCEADLRKVFALREKVEQVEAQTASKAVEDIKASEDILDKNAAQLDVAWARLEEAFHAVASLEHARFVELKRRSEEKAKDEHRRMEFAQFIKVCEDHCAKLELTIRNEDTALHCLELMSQSAGVLIEPIQTDLAHAEGVHKELLLAAHTQHLEVFRSLFLSVGEMLYRKQRAIEELEQRIQAAHVQQELCADTFDPNARKYRDAKKRLLEQRDELEQMVTDLKEKAAQALRNFQSSEEYLKGNSVKFVHPVVEHEQQCLAFKAKMLSYKAMVMGHTDGTTTRSELSSVQKDIMAVRETVGKNVERTALGALDRSLPLLAAASKSRPLPKGVNASMLSTANTTTGSTQ